jgi:Skp family chaperone for outer membrane proteins
MKLAQPALVLAGILAPLAGEVATTRPAVPIAYISLQKIGAESVRAKEAAKQMEALRLAKTQDVAAKQKALETTRGELANSGGLLAASRRATLKAQESRQLAELQQATQQGQGELQNLQRQLHDDLRGEMNDVVADIAKRRAFQFILNSDTAIVWAPPGSDLTTEVLERLNAAATSRKSSAK